MNNLLTQKVDDPTVQNDIWVEKSHPSSWWLRLC